MLPIFKNYKLLKKEKRYFLRESEKTFFYVRIGQTKQRNGIVIDYGEVQKTNDWKLAVTTDVKFARLKPSFWNLDYAYPIKKTDSKDEAIIAEIEKLLTMVIK